MSDPWHSMTSGKSHETESDPWHGMVCHKSHVSELKNWMHMHSKKQKKPSVGVELRAGGDPCRWSEKSQ